MNEEPQFLSFKGLKQYTPDAGWVMVPQQPPSARPPSFIPATPMQQPPTPAESATTPSSPAEIPTLTETLQEPAPAPTSEPAQPLIDPLMNELFAQLQVGPADDLTQSWQVIASEVDQLSQQMTLQRELQERLTQLDQEITDMQQSILVQLQQVQQAADQQLSTARLRAEVSSLALNKLSAKLSKT